jgi:hypothetical protein
MSSLTVAAMLSLAQACGVNVAPGTLLSVAWAESHWNATAEHTNRNGTIDRGIAQINSANWNRMGLTRATSVDPCLSLRASARILLEGYHPQNNTAEEQQRALRIALAAYNPGNPNYLHSIEVAAQHVIPEIRVAGIPAPADTPAPVAGAARSSPPTPDVTIRPASAGRELVFSIGNK